MAFAVPGRQPVRRGDVELAVDQFVDQMQRQGCVDRIVARLLLLVIARGGQPRPFRALEIGRERHVADRVAVIDEDRRQVVLVEQLLLVVADDDQRVEFGAAHALPQMLDRRLRFVMARGKALRRQFRQGSRVGAGQQFLIGRGVALLVEKVADPVAVDKARPVLGRGIQHRGVRGGDPEDDFGHPVPPAMSRGHALLAAKRYRLAREPVNRRADCCKSPPIAPSSPLSRHDCAPITRRMRSERGSAGPGTPCESRLSGRE